MQKKSKKKEENVEKKRIKSAINFNNWTKIMTNVKEINQKLKKNGRKGIKCARKLTKTICFSFSSIKK